VYKKIDSTLRGHPGAELAAAQCAMGTRTVLIAPAFPAQGRTTIGGRQLVWGRPLAQTPFGPTSRGSDLFRVFAHHAHPNEVRRIPLRAVRAGVPAINEALSRGPGLYIADAETDADLAQLAEAALDRQIALMCGSAGLAGALAAAAGLQATGLPLAWTPARAGPVLVVAGSRHPRTLSQIGHAQGLGAAVVRIMAYADGTWKEQAERAVREAGAHLARGVDVVIAASGPEGPPPDRRFAELLAEAARRLADRAALGGLVMTGGDTAVATLNALGSPGLALAGAVEAGIPWGRLWEGTHRGLPVVTKAGGFGDFGAVARAIDWLRGLASRN
jgi:uncharacterized protein YgbK (DUF1537 family)